MDTKKLRQKILDLAIHGKLVPQDPNDEPASVLLERIRAEKEKLIKEGKIKAPKKSKSAGDTSHYPKDVPFEVPEGWVWSTIGEFFNLQAGKFVSAEDIHIESPHFPYRCFGGNGIRGYVSSFNRRGDYPIIGRQGALCGNINYASGEFYATEHAVVVESFSGTDPIWAKYLLEQLNLNQYATATAQPGLSVKTINEVAIPIPPVGEQYRISDALTRCLGIINNIQLSCEDLRVSVAQTKSRVLELAIHGKLVPQNPSDEPAIELLKRINPGFQPSHNLHYEGKLPSGWMLCCLEDVLDYEQPQAYIVESTDYSDDYKTPVLTPGKSFVLGYTNETSGICNSLPVIIFDDFTTESKYVDFPFKVKSSAMKILHARGEINLEYVAIFMSITRLVGDTHKRYWISEYSKIPIPIPPQNEQRRIVETVGKHFQTLDSIRKLLQY